MKYRDVHPYEKGYSHSLINRILNVTLDMIGGGDDGVSNSLQEQPL
jgi:hypothetical protein